MPLKKTPPKPKVSNLRIGVIEETDAALASMSPEEDAALELEAKDWIARVLARGGDLEAAMAELEADGLLEQPPVPDYYAEHRAMIPAAVAPAPKPKPAPVDEVAQKRAKRKRAGVAYFTRIVDEDDWEDWE